MPPDVDAEAAGRGFVVCVTQPLASASSSGNVAGQKLIVSFMGDERQSVKKEISKC
jgi:hypothetical protein